MSMSEVEPQRLALRGGRFQGSARVARASCANVVRTEFQGYSEFGAPWLNASKLLSIGPRECLHGT